MIPKSGNRFSEKIMLQKAVGRSRHRGTGKMKTKLFVAGLVALSLSIASTAQAAIHGRQGEAPPWSFACMTDHGPSECREPMWIYGE
jgi:hypothetical protein